MSAYGSTPSPLWVPDGEDDPLLERSTVPDFSSKQDDATAASRVNEQRQRIQAHVQRMNTAAGDLLGVWKPHQVARVSWSIVVGGAVLVGLPVLVLHLASNLASIRVYLVVISTMFVGLAVPISLYSIRRHLLHFWVPPLQIYIVRILWMVPVYSVCTLCSLWLWVCGQEPYVYIPDAFRQCYESYTLYNLFGFMIAYLEMDQGLSAAQILRRAHPTVSFVTHAPPFSLRLGGKYGFLGCCASGDSNGGSPLDQLTRQDSNCALDGHSSGAKQTLLGGNDSGTNTTCVGRLLGPARRIDLLSPWAMGDEFVKNCRRGVLFYVATMPPLALLIVVLSLLGLYHEGNFSLYSPYFWIQAFYFGTSCWALYCLALFFVVARKELAPVKPLNKFLLVKGIVFFTWAQSLAISLAFYFVYDYKARHWTSEAARAAILGNGNGESADEGSYYDDGYDEEARKAAAVQALEDERMTNAGAVCDAVMCVEMLFFAIGHAMAFPSTQFQRVMPHHTTVLGDGPSDGTANGKPGGEEEAPLKAAAAGGSGDGGAAAAAVAAVAKRRLAENKQWLVEWGDYWANMRHSPAGVKYQNERMFGVADVHADTTETYRLVGSAVSDFAREAKVKTAAAAQSTRANLDKTLEKTRENLARGGGGGGGGGGGQPASPPSSPLPLPPRRDKEAASSPAALSSAAKDAERRGHSAFAKLLQSKTETPTAAAAAADTAAGGGGGGGAPSVYYSAKSSCEFESSSDDDDDGDEDTGLLV